MARLFLSTDDNAPVIAGADRTCLVNLLKKCLIEGYGSKQPVGGWTMPYSTADGRVGVFRNDHENGGLGHYLRVGQDDNNASNARYWDIRPFESMTGESEGTFPYIESPHRISISSTNNTVIRPWTLLASKTWMVLFIYAYNTEHAKRADAGSSEHSYSTYGFWFGDIEKWNPSDNYHSLFSVISEANSSQFGNAANASRNGVVGSAFPSYRFSRKSDGVGGAPSSHYCYVPHPQTFAVFGARGPEYNSASGLLVARAAINDGAAYSLRGWIPEMLVPLHPRPFENLERVEVNGKNYAAVCFSGGQTDIAGNCGQVLFELDAGE